MGRYIIKLNDFYMEWSTIVDAPVSYGMNLEDFTQYYREEYGKSGMNNLQERMERVELKGTSSINDTNVEDVISENRAGPDESELTKEEIIEAYCLMKPVRGNWILEDDGWKKRKLAAE